LSAGAVAWLTGFDGYRQLTRVTADDRLILDGVSNLHTLKAIRHIVPKATHCYDYFNNSLRFVYEKADIHKVTERIKSMGYQLATFDPSDAKEYGMLYNIANPDEAIEKARQLAEHSCKEEWLLKRQQYYSHVGDTNAAIVDLLTNL
jgi:hypothetical protein